MISAPMQPRAAAPRAARPFAASAPRKCAPLHLASRPPPPRVLAQSLLVSGESGAGKTETNKQLMNYLIWRAGTASSTSAADAGSKSLSQRILDTNPVLEALGNAKSIRNNNSSRFGKYVNLKFSTDWKVMGAEVRTFLLEKSRVTNASLAKERSYHIFYQLLAGAQAGAPASATDVPGLTLLSFLSGKAPTDFVYTSLSGTGFIDSIDDIEDFAAMDAALTSCGIDAADKRALYGTFSALLYLGNVTFDGAEDSGGLSMSASVLEHLRQAEELLGITDISQLLVEKVVHSPRSSNVYHIALKKQEAIKQRDALVRQIYSMLFEYVVARLNNTINTEKDSYRFIGALECADARRGSRARAAGPHAQTCCGPCGPHSCAISTASLCRHTSLPRCVCLGGGLERCPREGRDACVA